MERDAAMGAVTQQLLPEHVFNAESTFCNSATTD